MPTKQQKFPLSQLLGNCPFNRHEITKQYQKHNYLVKIYKNLYTCISIAFTLEIAIFTIP